MRISKYDQYLKLEEQRQKKGKSRRGGRRESTKDLTDMPTEAEGILKEAFDYAGIVHTSGHWVKGKNIKFRLPFFIPTVGERSIAIMIEAEQASEEAKAKAAIHRNHLRMVEKCKVFTFSESEAELDPASIVSTILQNDPQRKAKMQF